MNNAIDHPDAEVLESHLLNRLIPREKGAVEQHLLACPKCKMTAKGLQNDIQLIRCALG